MGQTTTVPIKETHYDMLGNLSVDTNVEVSSNPFLERKVFLIGEDDAVPFYFDSGNTTSDNDGFADTGRLNEVARKNKRYVRFNEKNMKNPKFFPGLVFSSSEQFKEVMRWYATTRRKDIWYSCNENSIFGVRCKFPCEWSVWLSREKKLNDTNLVIKTMSRKHKNCLSSKRRRLVMSTWLAKVLEDWIRLLPDMSLNVFKIAVDKKFGLMITSNHARRAREKALLAIQGDHEDQYNQIWDYIKELKRRTHPGSTIFAEYDDDAEMQMQGSLKGFMYF
ncbi:hypothetical protein LIER_33836 [Lithospermum erythrorhizon]|uniref:Transposase MuDR plant domain-containing protein n=1 Tax=Lithospermum erythrorhizon TaxID=34254 RepID=A0AAV3RZK3_LITER